MQNGDWFSCLLSIQDKLLLQIFLPAICWEWNNYLLPTYYLDILFALV